MAAKSIWTLLALAVLCVPFFGSEPIPWSALADKASTGYHIFFQLRLPRFLAVLCTGAGLAVLGGTYQTIFHNPLAEPYLLGVSNAVTLGIALAEIVFGVTAPSLISTVAGLVGAGAVTALVLAVHWYRPRAELALFGMGVQFVLSSVLFLLLSYHSQTLGGGSLRWLFGQVPWLSPTEAGLYAGAAMPLIGVLWLAGRSLDALSLGDSVARTLGVHPQRQRARLLGLSSALVALIVGFVGAVGFVGLVVPHAVQKAFRPKNTRILFLLSALVGAGFLALADLLSRVLLPPIEFPIGILTTLVGGPLFLWLLGRRR